MNPLAALGLGSRTLVMGVLNVTPDSFSDGGQYGKPELALSRAHQMVEEGADIIDIGGESTRPATFSDNLPLDLEEELRRTIPVIRLLSREFPAVQISIDSYKAEVARQALSAGAGMVNDVSGLTFDPQMAEVVASAGCPVVIMHLLGAPRNVQVPRYVDVIDDIKLYFNKQIEFAESVGISKDQIILDPGIGFGKNVEHNLTILRRLNEFKKLGMPVMVGPSRKAFIGKVLADAAPEARLEGTLASVAIAIANGADIVRVHDVKEAVKTAKMVDAIVRA